MNTEPVVYDDFCDEQKQILDIFRQQVDHFVEHQDNPWTPDFTTRVFVQGRAGSGKSCIINYMARTLREKFADYNVFMLLATTGMAAINISGKPVHSGLHLQTRQFLNLTSKKLPEYRKEFAKIQFIVLDEVSMLGCRMLRWIDLRLRELKNVD